VLPPDEDDAADDEAADPPKELPFTDEFDELLPDELLPDELLPVSTAAAPLLFFSEASCAAAEELPVLAAAEVASAAAADEDDASASTVAARALLFSWPLFGLEVSLAEVAGEAVGDLESAEVTFFLEAERAGEAFSFSFLPLVFLNMGKCCCERARVG
jgi:hypothetical protein